MNYKEYEIYKKISFVERYEKLSAPRWRELVAPHAGVYALSYRNLELAVHTQAKRRQRV